MNYRGSETNIKMLLVAWLFVLENLCSHDENLVRNSFFVENGHE